MGAPEKLRESSPKSVLRWVDSPLGFFTLALLICECFLSVVLTLSNLSEPHQFLGMWGGTAMFVFVAIQVFLLVWYKPKHLVFDRQSHLSENKSRSVLADEIINTEYTTYMGQKAFQMAEFACEKALQYDENNERAKISLALALAWQDKHSDSIRVFDEVIVHNPKSAKAHYNRACVRASMTKHEKTPESVDRLVRMAVKDVKIAVRLASYYKRLLSTDEDLKVIQDRPEFQKLLGELKVSPATASRSGTATSSASPG